MKDSSPVEVSDPAKKMRNDASGMAVNFHTMTAPCIIQQVERSNAPIPSLSFFVSPRERYDRMTGSVKFTSYFWELFSSMVRARARSARALMMYITA